MRRKPRRIQKGAPCPECKGHDFEIVKRGHGVTMFRCETCGKVVTE